MKTKSIITMFLMLVFVIGVLIAVLFAFRDRNVEQKDEEISNIEIKYNNGQKYYVINGDYEGEYDYQDVDLSELFGNYEKANDKIDLFNTSDILTYKQYNEFCEKWNLNKKYKDENKNYMIVSYAVYGKGTVEARLANVIENEGKVTLYMWENTDHLTANVTGFCIAIPVSLSTNQNEINIAYTKEEYKNMVKYGSKYDLNEQTVKKPIIYIYPEKDTKVDIELLNSSLVTTSYPKYNDGWSVIANPNGNLKELNSNRIYYGLYYEAKNHNVQMKDNGFVVKGEDVIKFLEEKLEILGLNEREINEFIIYWLPVLESNKYNYIRFETQEEIENYMPIKITPKPDSIIRVVMDYKPLNEKIQITEQKLIPQIRYGYSIVEWGGSEIK